MSKKIAQTDDTEARNIYLMNLVAELESKLKHVEDKRYEDTKTLEQQLKLVTKERDTLKVDVCEWTCTTCVQDYYGRSAVEAGSLQCPKCKSFCIPKKFSGTEVQPQETHEIIEHLEVACEIKVA